MQKILVPIDFSENSASALKYATALAREMKAEIFVLYVFDKNESRFLETLAAFEGWPMPPNPPVPVDVWLREKSLDLYNFIQTVIPNAGTLRISKRVRMGSRFREMLQTAKEENVDLIVVRAPKNRFLSHLFPRRALMKFIWKVPYPVLLTPASSADSSTPRGPLLLLPILKPPDVP
jgi:nucleotide-binding universal stress UspA family protein